MRLLVAVPPGGMPDGFARAVMESARGTGAEVRALYTVDDRWFGYSGSDWLSNASSRAEFDAYMRLTLQREGEASVGELSTAAAVMGVAFSCTVAEGEPAGTAYNEALAWAADAVVTTSTHPGLKDIRRKCGCPVLLK